MESSLDEKVSLGSKANDESLDSLLKKLAANPMFRHIAPETLHAMAAEFEWFSLPGGQVLFRQDDRDDSLYVVLSGRLGAFIRNEDGREVLIRQMTSGETVGEMAMLSAEPRSATVIALRDAELVRLSKSAFETLADKHPRTLRFITDLLVRRLRQPPRPDAPAPAPKTIWLCPLDREVAYADFVRSAIRAFDQLGFKATAIDHTAASQSAEWLSRLEEAHDVVVYQGDFELTPWTRQCLRQADRLVLLADVSRPFATAPSALEAIFSNPLRIPTELVLVHTGRGSGHPQTHSYLTHLDGFPHHHVREALAADFRRLARLIIGRATGVVLSGGGARGIAHVGVIRALREAGLELDLFGGTSMGAIVAAGAALEWDDQSFLERMRATFFDDNPVSDYTLPMIALVRGRKASRFLRQHFADQQIEDCPCSFFCVSSNLTTSRLKIHRTGPIWNALRASSAIPGVLPPVIDGSEILIDGGLVDNLPIDVMREMRRGPIVAVDVSSDYTFRASIDEIDRRSLWQLAGHARRGTPNIFTVLFAAGTMGSFAQSRELRKSVELLIEPPLPGVSLLSWKTFHRAVDAGYRHTLEVLERNQGVLPTTSYSHHASSFSQPV